MLGRFFSLLLVATALTVFSGCSSAKATKAPAPEYQNCATDAECASHSEVCLNGACVQCSGDAQCTAKDVCGVCQADHTCGAKADCCRNDGDCEGGTSCVLTPGSKAGSCR